MADASTAIDLSPVLTPILQVIGIAAGTIVTAFVSWALAKWGGKLSAETKAQLTANLDDAAMKAISAGVMASQVEIKAKGYDHVDVQNKIVLESTRYFIEKFQDRLKVIGADPSTPEGQKNIHDLINRALPAGVAAVATSPTTPAAPAAAPSTIIVNAPSPQPTEASR